MKQSMQISNMGMGAEQGGDADESSNEPISIDPQQYPNLKIEDGDSVTLRVKGTAAVDENGMISITPSSIERTGINPAKQQLKSMTGPRKKSSTMSPMMSEEDY